MAAPSAEEKAPADEYDGPWIERRITWKCPDRKQHDVVLFGSWSRFEKGEELEYQGKQMYAVTAQLPLGSYVYRFMIDSTDWETDNGTAKTVKDGIEYNTITVRQGSDSDDEDDDDEEEENTTKANVNKEEDKGAENTQLIFDEKKQKFVVGKKKKGKRRGRPSMELDLGANFADEDADDEETTDKSGGNTGADTDTATTDNGGDGDDSGKKKKKKKKKTKKYTAKGGDVDIQQEKEWARYVFVQQLRQQQQHNDEINRVKTLWKQERQVRVEMHKKVVKEKRKLEKDIVALKAENEKLEKLNQITTDADKKEANRLEKENKRLEAELQAKNDELKEAKEATANLRKAKAETEKSEREHETDWESQRKQLTSQISALEAQVQSLKSQNESAASSLDVIKSGNTKTMEYQKQQFDDMQKRWEDERAESTKLKEEIKKYKTDISEKSTQLQEAQDNLAASNKKCSTATARNKELQTRIDKLKGDMTELRSSTEAADKVRVEVEKAKSEAESEKSVLNDKIKSLTDKLEELKSEHAKEIESVKQQTEADMNALKANSDSEMGTRLDELKKELDDRDAQIKNQKDNIDKLENDLGEEKTNSDNLDKKLATLTETHTALTKDKEDADKMITEMKEEIERLQGECQTAKDEGSSANEAAQGKIEALEKEIAATNERHTGEVKDLEDQNTKLSEQCATLTEDLNKRSAETTEISAKLTETEQECASLKATEASLKTQVESLEKSLQTEQEEASTKAGEYQKQMDDLSGQLETIRTEKDTKISELEENVAKVRTEMGEKLKEFHNAETKIASLESDIEAQKKTFAIEKDDYEKQLSTAHEKDERIHASCKKLNTQFEGIRDEMKAIKDLKISQLEEMVNAFKEFSPVLEKVFTFNQSMVDDLMQKYKRELTLRRKYFNIVQDLRGNIRVFCRVRPILPFEIQKGDTSCLTFPEPGKIVVEDEKQQTHNFEFDQVYAPGTTQEAVSEDTTEYIQSVMDGYNVSIFAYGQTGSGKTYTMDGSHEEPGVNLRALKHLFKMAEERAPQFEYKIKVAIFEIYNEVIRDLLLSKKKAKAAKNDKRAFKILHLPDGSVEVSGLTWKTVSSDADVVQLGDLAKSQRTAGVTDMNAHSSRSHMVMVVDVKGFNLPANIEYIGKLYLVDLAGSERVKKSGATGQAMKEAQNINKSLAALGDVMQALQKKEKFIPYRNSTLTDLMTNSLGGNAKTVMFINCCPTARHAFETVSSLKFASRVGKVELGQAKAKQKKKKAAS